MSNKYGNSRKQSFVKRVPEDTISSSDLGSRCSFNFSFFDGSQEDGSSWEDLNDEKLRSVLTKINSYTRNSLANWKRQEVLVEYEDFPAKKITKFVHPPHVPADVSWARFRLEGAFRLVGFLIPTSMHGEPYIAPKGSNENHFFSRNTFYVVFLDEKHKFWMSEKK